MAQRQGVEHHAASSAEEEIHLPSPTIAPPTIGLGVLVLTFGVAGLSPSAPDALRGASPILLIVGGILIVLGLAVWLVNDARESAHGDGHGGH